MKDLSRLSIRQIRDCLAQGLRQDSSVTYDIETCKVDAECEQAAVLIPFVQCDNQWHLVFIRRALHERDQHSGQVAFAGGKFETEDNNLQVTALREAQEEIGVMPEDVTILGELNEHHSISRFRITPVVAHISWPYNLTLNRHEVARVFTVPLNWLANPLHHKTKQYSNEKNTYFPVVYFDEYDGEILWGATARMTLTLISLLYDEQY